MMDVGKGCATVVMMVAMLDRMRAAWTAGRLGATTVVSTVDSMV